MKKIFALAMVVVMALALCACGEKGGTPANLGGNSFEGEWESTKIEYEGESITGEAAAGFVFVIAQTVQVIAQLTVMMQAKSHGYQMVTL